MRDDDDEKRLLQFLSNEGSNYDARIMIPDDDEKLALLFISNNDGSSFRIRCGA